MFTPVFTNQFKRDFKRVEKRKKDIDKLEEIISLLVSGKALKPKHRDHDLSGNYVNHRECHIEPDWLLIYKKEQDSIIFERTGSHADLF